MMKGEYVSRIGGSCSDSKVQPRKRNSEQSHCVLMYTHRNKVRVWPNLAKCFKSTNKKCVWNIANISEFTTVSVQIDVHLAAHTCEYGVVR
jgi:hypothetical protein